MKNYLLIGMLDSPFVRRVAIALELYGFEYENLALRTVGDAERFAEYSPLRRAPTLKLPNGELLFDSHLILAHLDEQVDPGRVLLPREPKARLLARQVIAIAAGIADKSVDGVYEKVFHPSVARSPIWLQRIESQLQDSALWLEGVAPAIDYLHGTALSHADIIVGTALCFAREAHPDWLKFDRSPRLKAWLDRLDALPVFQRTYLPLEPPKA